MQNLDDTISAIKDLKIKAKNRRDIYRYEQAIKYLDEAIHKLQLVSSEEQAFNENEKREINSQLADCYGIKGGVYRRWGLSSEFDNQRDKLKKSLECYDIGYEYEMQGLKANSYNLVNRLIAKIFFNPLIFKKYENDSSSKLIKELRQADDILQEQLKLDRKGDIWALADEVVIKILLREQDLSLFLSGFVSRSPDSFVYKSLLETLIPLSQLAIPQKNEIHNAINFLEKYKPE